MNILEMDRDALLALKPEDVDKELSPEEVVHMANVLGARWAYDYTAADQGRVGLHAELKSGLHSDGFFVSRILLAEENIRRIVASQIVMKLRGALDKLGQPDYIVGIPDGATKLGEDVADLLDVDCAEMVKEDGQIKLVTELQPGDRILFIEDFCTRGTGYVEAAGVVREAQPEAVILPLDPVILNRGGLTTLDVPGLGNVEIVACVEWRVKDWPPESCELCAKGSKPIKPKATDENWHAITTSQIDQSRVTCPDCGAEHDVAECCPA